MNNLDLKVRPDHTKECGIYAKAVKAARKDIALAEDMVRYVDENDQAWQDKYGLKAWAIAHGQLTDSPEPKRIFVVHAELMDERLEYKNARFYNRIVVNPVLIEADTQIEREREVRKTVADEDGKRSRPKLVKEKVMVSNVIPMQEGCMSFPDRKPKKIDRIFRVKVRYQYPVSFLGFKFLWWKTEVVEGLKAQIFQHEISHFEGENIFYETTHKS